jgi:HD-GYP domain-containing protein (c-di-GMP phosphodiesterase class II)
MRDPSRASCEAGHVSEWWNGAGGPAGLRGPVTPLSARIAAVADTWSSLTARGTPELSHSDALDALDSAAGTRLDPYVVLAAHTVVAQERVSAAEPAPEPRLHRFRLPARLRAVLAAG